MGTIATTTMPVAMASGVWSTTLTMRRSNLDRPPSAERRPISGDTRKRAGVAPGRLCLGRSPASGCQPPAGELAPVAEVPLDLRIRELSDDGRPVVVAEPGGPQAAAYLGLARSVAAKLDGRHAKPRPRIVYV